MISKNCFSVLLYLLLRELIGFEIWVSLADFSIHPTNHEIMTSNSAKTIYLDVITIFPSFGNLSSVVRTDITRSSCGLVPSSFSRHNESYENIKKHLCFRKHRKAGIESKWKRIESQWRRILNLCLCSLHSNASLRQNKFISRPWAHRSSRKSVAD